MVVFIVVGLLVFVFGLLVALGHGMTRASYGARIARRETILLTSLLVVSFLGAGVLVWWVRDDWEATVWITIYLGFALIAWSLIAVSIMHRRRAGPILLNLGSGLGHWINLVVITCYLVFVIGPSVFDLVSRPSTAEDVARLLFQLTFVSVLLVNARSTMQVREGGIVHQWFIPWTKIRGYAWENDQPTILTLQVQTWFPWLAERNFSVPAAHRDAVAHLLAQHVPSTTNDQRELAM